MGFSGHNRSKEFAAFCLHPQKYSTLYPNRYTWWKDFTFKTEKVKVAYGNLRFEDNLVWSYSMLIGVVDRKHQIILWNTDAERFSRTTTQHLSAIQTMDYVLPDWASIGVPGLSSRENSVKWLKRQYPSLRIKDWPDVRNFKRVARIWDQKLLDARIKEYIGLDPEQRLAMRGLIELANETQTS